MNRSLLYSTSAFSLPPLAFRLPPLALFSFTKRLEKILWHSLSIVFTVACENNRGFRCVSQRLRIEPMWIHPMWGGCLLHQRRRIRSRAVSYQLMLFFSLSATVDQRLKQKIKQNIYSLIFSSISISSSSFSPLLCLLFVVCLRLLFIYCLFCFVLLLWSGIFFSKCFLYKFCAFKFCAFKGGGRFTGLVSFCGDCCCSNNLFFADLTFFIVWQFESFSSQLDKK